MPNIPLKTPWDLFPTSDVAETLWVELVNRHSDAYQRIAPGTPHPDRSKYPGVVLADEKPVDGTEDMVRRFWASDEQNPDTFNYGVTNALESASHPVWARRYRKKRTDTDLTLTYLTAFSGVWLIRITDGGSGYETPPAVTLTGGGGTGATAVAIIDKGLKTVSWVRITAEGTSYTSVPTVAFVGGGGGTGATAVAVMQGAAKLVHQEIQPIDPSDSRSSVWVTVLRVWETLPGATINTTDFNRQRAFGSTATTAVTVIATGSAEDTLPALSTTTLDAATVAIDANRKRKTVTTIPAQQPVTGTHIDETTGIAIDYVKLFVAAGTTGGLSGTTYTEIQPIDVGLSLSIASTLRVDTVPADKQYFRTAQDSFPNVLKDIELFIVADSATQTGSAWNLIEGYSGPLQARVTRKYMTDAEYQAWDNTDVGTIFQQRPPIVQFFPQANRMAVKFGVNTLYTKDFPESLHEEIEFSLLGGTITATLPATKPTDLPYLTWIVRRIEETQIRFGYWIIEIVEHFVPPDPQV